jgi:acyl dehydratase
MSLITDEMRALIGVRGEPVTSAIPVSEELLRRFVHGVMEDNPVHWDHEVAAKSRYGEVVAPPLFVSHVHRRAPGDPDPFERFVEEPDHDGTLLAKSGTTGGLPAIETDLKSLLNGGTEAEFYQLAKVGDVITAQSEYLDVTERESRSGPMLIIRIATTYTNQHGELLAVITNSIIRR